ncbi:MAG: hypothetical protein JEZ12_15940 [Desulfobacterium sp.]|nr:hypothetical protein [Desulfobacterium sp.]
MKSVDEVQGAGYKAVRAIGNVTGSETLQDIGQQGVDRNKVEASAYDYTSEEIANRFGKNAAALPPSDGIVDKGLTAWDIGKFNTELGSLRYREMEGDTSPQTVKRIAELKAEMKARGHRPEIGNIFEEAVESAASFAPNMIESFKQGQKQGLQGAIAGTALGASTGPASPITAPAGAAAGYSAGAIAGGFDASRKLEAGLAYDEMLETGINSEVAKVAAHIYGAAAGAVEVAQIRTILGTIPGGKKLMGSMLKETAAKVAEKLTKSQVLRQGLFQYGKAVGVEVSQELTQEAMNIAATETAKVVSNKTAGTSIGPATSSEIASRMGNVLVDSILGLGMMSGPGSIISTSIKMKDVQKNARQNILDNEGFDGEKIDENVEKTAYVEEADKPYTDLGPMGPPAPPEGYTGPSEEEAQWEHDIQAQRDGTWRPEGIPIQTVALGAQQQRQREMEAKEALDMEAANAPGTPWNQGQDVVDQNIAEFRRLKQQDKEVAYLQGAYQNENNIPSRGEQIQGETDEALSRFEERKQTAIGGARQEISILPGQGQQEDPRIIQPKLNRQERLVERLGGKVDPPLGLKGKPNRGEYGGKLPERATATIAIVKDQEVFDAMQTQVNDSQSRGNGRDEAGDRFSYGASSPKWMENLQASAKAGGQQLFGRKELNVLFNKVRNGWPLTEKQNARFDMVRDAAVEMKSTDSSFAQAYEAEEMESQGYTPMGGQEVVAADLESGSSFIGTVDGTNETWDVTVDDDSVTMRSEALGIEKNIDLFDSVKVDGIKSGTQTPWGSRDQPDTMPGTIPAPSQKHPVVSPAAPTVMSGPPAVKTSKPPEAKIIEKKIKQEVKKVDTAPTEKQKEAGNYKKGHIKIQGFDISIENPDGSTRSGVDAQGNAWESRMHGHYGYFKRTLGNDGDHVDVVVAPGATDSPKIFVVDQVDPESFDFDEHKVMFGVNSEEEAEELYLSNYADGWEGLGGITEMNPDEFKAWVKDEKRTKKPLYKENESVPVTPEATPGRVKKETTPQDIQAASRKIAGAWSTRVLISDLRKSFPNLSREEFDTKIKEMQSNGELQIYPLDDPKEHTPENMEGGIQFGGQTNHIVYVPEPVKGKTSQQKQSVVPGKPKGKVKLSKPSKQIPKPSGLAAAKIEDFGEKIGGARKDYAVSLEKAKGLETAKHPLSKTFPEPKYDDLLKKDVDPYIVGAVRAMRDEIPNKPRQTWKLKRWVEEVEALRGFSEKLLNGDIDPKRFKEKLGDSILSEAVGSRAELYTIVGHSKSLKGVKLSKIHYSLYHGEKNVTKWEITKQGKSTAFSNMPRVLGTGNTKQEAIDSFVKKYESFKNEDKGGNGGKRVKFDFYTYRRDPSKKWIGKKVGRNTLDLKSFDTIEKAKAYLENNYDDLLDLLNKAKYTPDVRRKANEDRIGNDYRGDKDVTPEMFSNAFGFRGVEFGNWVSKAEERQVALNNAFDAFSDLADILNIPTKAISLNGGLGLAFGARGSGGKNAAAAHYEPDKVVINLTRKQGAGSFAHEWWHALDNYFSRNRNYPSEYLSERPYQLSPGNEIRQEIADAFKRIVEAYKATDIEKRSAKLDRKRSKKYWGTGREISARIFESYVIDKLSEKGYSNDYLANIIDELGFTNDMLENMLDDDSSAKDFYPYLADSEKAKVNDAFDQFFNAIRVKKTEKGEALYSTKSNIPDVDVNVVENSGEWLEGLRFDQARKEAKAWALKNLREKYRNEDTGWDIEITRKGILKAASGRFDPNHLKAIQSLPQLIKKSVKVVSRPDRSEDVNIKQIHRFFVPLKIEEELYVAKLTIKETVQGQKFYDHALIEIEKPVSGYLLGHDQKDSEHQAPTETDSKIRLRELLKNVNEKELLYSTRPIPAGQNVTLQQIQKWFKGQDVGLSPDNSVWVRLQNGAGLRIKSVKMVAEGKYLLSTKAGQMDGKGRLIAGKYASNEIELVEGVVDGSTLSHEIEHWLEDIGVITALDQSVMDVKIKAMAGKDQLGFDLVKDQRENRANFLAQYLADRKQFRGTPVGRVLQKIADFLDAVLHLGRASTRKLARGIESGKLFSREARAAQGGKAQHSTAPDKKANEATVNALFKQDDSWTDSIKGFTDKALSKEERDLAQDRFLTKTLDHLHFIKARLGDRAYKMHRLLTGAKTATVAMFLEHGALSWDGDVLSVKTKNKGVLPFLKSIGPDWQNLLYWIAAKRAEDLDAQGRENWLTEDRRQAIFDKVGTHSKSGKSWEFLNKRFQTINKNVLDVAEQAGLIDPEARASWEQEFYIPFYRIFEDPVTKAEFLSGPTAAKKHITSQIRWLKGGEAQIGDLMQNSLKNWMYLIDAAARNKARGTAFDTGVDLGIIEEVEKKDLVNILGSQTVKQFAVIKAGGKKANAIFDTEEEADAWAYHLTDKKGKNYNVEPRETVSIKFGSMKDLGILSFQRDGKPVYFKTEDNDLYEAMQELDMSEFNFLLMKLMGKAKRGLSLGATIAPAFRVANGARDTVHTAVVSKSFLPVWDSAVGFVKAMANTKEYREYMATGAGFGSSYASDDLEAGAAFIKRIVKREGEGAVKRILTSPRMLLDVWEKIGEASENAARVQLYSNLKKKGVSTLDAAFEGRDLMDFTMIGSSGSVQTLVRIIPFLNARFQGLYKLGRAAKKNPLPFFVKSVMLMTASMAIWGLYKDDDRYKGLDDWDKWSYVHFWIGGKHFRIPKPFEVGALFCSLPETIGNVLNGTEDSKMIMDWFVHTARSTFNIDTPQLFKPVIEHWANKNTFTGRAIVPKYMEKLPKEEQYHPWTSETAREISKKFNSVSPERFKISPLKIEHYIYGYMATLGKILLDGTDIVTRKKYGYPDRPAGEKKAWDLRKFVSDESKPPRSTKYLTRFYEMYDEIGKAQATFNNYKNTGQREKAQAWLKENAPVMAMKNKGNQVKKVLSVLSAEMKRVQLSNKYSAAEKKQKIDKLTAKRNRVVQKGFEAIRQASKKHTEKTEK